MNTYIQTSRRKVFFRTTPLWMAVVNATPDSFSDGGREDIIGHAVKLIRDGADILDVGGESTRPGALPVPVDEEIARITPVIRGIFAKCKAESLSVPPLSVDTRNPETACVALHEGVEILNDITGGEHPKMQELALSSGAALCFMHMQGNPRIMQENPHYENVVKEVFTYLSLQRDTLLQYGLRPEQLIADPGIGFGKTAEHNLEILWNIEYFKHLNLPLLVGHSRKRFLDVLGPDREVQTEKISRWLAEKKVEILRLHTRPKF
ncbi:MAG: dihydropteroate synthase [Planctomycetia bacterium]|nr:dihydropteroate synthase [Planctomycetia bacterium]